MCPYVRGDTCKKKQKTFKPRARNNNHTGRSFALTCPYVHGRTCVAVRAKKQLSNNHTGRSFALVNDDWIGALCLSINAHKKSRNYQTLKRHILRSPASNVTSYQTKKKKNCDVNCDVIAPCPVICLANKWALGKQLKRMKNDIKP